MARFLHSFGNLGEVKVGEGGGTATWPFMSLDGHKLDSLGVTVLFVAINGLGTLKQLSTYIS